MNEVPLSNLLIVIPIGIAFLIIAILGWRREMEKRREETARRERIRNARLPEGAAFIATEGVPEQLGPTLLGTFVVVGIGTYGLHQSQRLLTLLYRCGLERMVSAILIVENDAQNRNQFHAAMPAVYYDRLVYGFSEQYSGGMGNLPIDIVLEQIDVWGVPVMRAVAEVIDLSLRRNGNQSPSNIFLFTSLGGHAPLGLPVLEALHGRFEDSMAVGFTALPSHGPLRERFERLKVHYDRLGLHGWMLSDNLEEDAVSADYAMDAVLVGLSDAALHADQQVQVNNVLTLALGSEPGSILIYQLVTDSVAGNTFQPDHSVKPRYYVFKQHLVDRILKSLRRIETNRGKWSADLPIHEKGTSIFDVVMTSLYHGDLQSVEDEVNIGRRLRQKQYLNGRNGHGQRKNGVNGAAHLIPTSNYASIFGSLVTNIDPEKPVCPIVIVRLAAVRHGADLVHEMVKVPEERAPRMRAARLLPSGSKKTKSNGHAPRTNGTKNKSKKEKRQ